MSRLPTPADKVPQVERLATLTVEPTFLGALERHTRATCDPDMEVLKTRAGTVDGTYRYVHVSGHRVLERSGPHGKQLVVPPEGGLR